MGSSVLRTLRVLWLSCVVATCGLWGCGDDDGGTGSDAGEDGGSSVGAQAGSGASHGSKHGDAGASQRDAGQADLSPLLDAPEADEVASLELDSEVDDVVYAEDLALGLHTENDVSILDLSDPKTPKAISKLPTTGRAVGAVLDPQLRILFIVSASGDLRAYRVADLTGPVQIAQVTIAEPGQSGEVMRGLVRVGQRLMLLGKKHLLPVQIVQGNAGSIALLAETEVALDDGAERIEVGGGAVFVGFAGGKVQIWSATSSPAKLDEASLGADISGWVVRGRRLFVALHKLGLRVVDMTVPSRLRVLFDAPELDDLAGLKRFGNLVIVALERGSLVALDLSDFSAPRALVRRAGALPKWIAPIGGNLLLGTGKQLSVFGVPPFVSASVPLPSAQSFPRYGKIPLQLSKPVDPKTVTIQHVKLDCGGTAIDGSVVLSLDNLHLTFLPSTSLPAGVQCSLSLQGVRDALGLELSAGPSMMSFTTTMAEPAPVMNPHSSYPHTADGELTDWSDGAKADYEYFDVTAAQGMYSHFYADYDGSKLWLLNDWFYNGDDVDPDCYNQFGVWTGNGNQQWEIRAYGDQHIEVRLNGSLLEADDARVTGGYAHVATANDAEPHTVYEIAIATDPGGWGVQLHDPGPTFSCHQLESDPTNYLGTSSADSSSVDPTQGPTTPSKPLLSTAQVLTGTPTLSWGSRDASDMTSAFDSYVLELSSGEDLSHVIYRVVVYGGYFNVPAGLLQDGMTYTWRVTAYNLAGTTVSDSATFTVGAAVQVGAPMVTAVDPSSLPLGAASTLTITGTSFVEGARAYFDGTELSTTFVSSTSLTAMVPASLIGTEGAATLTVRNLPSDDATTSNAAELVVVAQSTGVTLSSLDPNTAEANVANDITVNLTDAGVGLYTLVLTPTQGGNASTFTCSYQGNNQCTASVNLPAGGYAAHVTVGEGVTAYDTNTIKSALTVNAAGVNVGLVGLSKTTINANVATAVGVTLSDAPSNGTYSLVLTPMGTQQSLAGVTCDWTSTTHCDATLNVSMVGTYDVKLVVGPYTYDTNTLSGAIIVTAPVACAHSPCFPGARLNPACSACVADICNEVANAGCCSTTPWTPACIDATATYSSDCTCQKPNINDVGTVSPNTMAADQTVQVTVDLQNAMAGYEYTLRLTPHGAPDGSAFTCTYNDQTGDCTASVMGIPITGQFDVAVQVRDVVTMQSIFTDTVANAFTITTPI